MRSHRRTGRMLGIAAVCTLVVLLVLPIVVYVHTFGERLSDVHARWGEMGSAMSGIYGPILSLLGFGVLIMQVQLQRQTNRHMFEQAYVQDARADLEYYLTQLVAALDAAPTGEAKARELLKAWFERVSVDALKGDLLRDKAAVLNGWLPQLFSIWTAIAPILAGLRTYKGTSYELYLRSAMQKIIAMTTFDTAVALDNYVWCQSEGRVRSGYEFSPNFRDA